MPLALLIFAVLVAGPAAGQALPESDRDTSDSLATGSSLFLRIDGTVSAQTLVHRTAPDIEVRFSGDVVDTLSVDRRDNLPRPVVPGVTYRDVRVTFEVRSGLPNAGAFLDALLRPREASPGSAQPAPSDGQP
ncbi:MAG TPA: hypothetical protein VF594_04480 [Rubricoccaceae bacterium]|jgi:hypothetical protein